MDWGLEALEAGRRMQAPLRLRIGRERVASHSSPKDTIGRRSPAQRTATPIHEEAACLPILHIHGHLPEKPM